MQIWIKLYWDYFNNMTINEMLKGIGIDKEEEEGDEKGTKAIQAETSKSSNDEKVEETDTYEEDVRSIQFHGYIALQDQNNLLCPVRLHSSP